MSIKQCSGGLKFDGQKPRLDLIPRGPIWAVAKVLGFGAQKYDSWNWIQGIEFSRLLAATYRHLDAYMAGEDIDAESGLSHIAHALCELMFLMQFIMMGRSELDDRYKHMSDMYTTYQSPTWQREEQLKDEASE